MSGRLDQSLDSIIDSQKKAKREARRRRVRPGKPGVVVAPVGGVKKATKPAKAVVKGVSGGPSAVPRESKIVVSGLVSLYLQHLSVESILILYSLTMSTKLRSRYVDEGDMTP